MITSKQRSFLKSMANRISPVVMIGRAGLTENVESEVDRLLEHRELIKIKIQEGSDLDPKETASLLADKLGAEFVQAIGRKFVLYRESKEHKEIELPR